MSDGALVLAGMVVGLFTGTVGMLTYLRLRLLSAQMAVLTISVKNVQDTLMALDAELHAVDETLQKVES